MQEELGRGNEWGRPELTKKMLALTPGQRIEIVKDGQPTGEWEFELKQEFLKRLRNESLEEGMFSNLIAAVNKKMEANAKMNTQRGHYEKWKAEEAKKNKKKAK